MTTPRSRWTAEKANEWYTVQPWFVGCNFIPSTAINQLEMWQRESFDLRTIDRELSWASGIGFNAARVFLHDLVWRQDCDGFQQRIDQYLEVADRHGVHTLFVLFDGVWDPYPELGPQRQPRPGVHNSGWVQSPGAAILGDRPRHTELRDYVGGIIGAFRDDERILGWDLFNEPDNPNPAYGNAEISNKSELATALLRDAFEWARACGPLQPITAGVWRGAVDERAAEITRLMLEESDVISFHSYLDSERVERRISDLDAYERPILLTEFMARSGESTFESILPVAKAHKVGSFCWGLVSGKTQTIYPWDSWVKRYHSEPDPWFHDVLHPDGTPYSRAEAESLRRITRA